MNKKKNLTSVGTFEAKTKFSELLEKVSRGAEIVITKHERPIAKLVPYASKLDFNVDALFQRIDDFRSQNKLNSEGKDRVTYHELVEEGRKR